MRLDIAALAMLIAVATSQVAISPVFGQEDVFVELIVEEDEPALEWDIEVTQGSPSTDHLTLEPISLGSYGSFTVALTGSAATLKLTTTLPADRELVNVGCLDNLDPPTEIDPIVDPSSFEFVVVSGRRYSCSAASLPTALADPAAAPADATDRLLPKSDSLATVSATSPGWPTVLITLIVISAIALLLRPARR